ncbi:MAG: dihydrodipicolinate synthase family protein [Acidobacteria bacterium]|nr:dihydrodipicolinate synthase family protein [Acidobacteriota bacterium]
MLRGILVPFPTPFDAGGEVDARALRANIERWNLTGVSGYVALGSTGERVHLDERERLGVVEAARGAVPHELAFVVGVGEQSTRATIADARRMAGAGADAVLVLTPHFYRGAMTADVLCEYFSAIADASPVPILLYNIPQNTGVALAPEVVARLSLHENIRGLKDSSGDMLALIETLRLVGPERDDFVVMTGHGGALYAALCAGARGAILAVGCAAPELCVAVSEAVEAGDYGRARALQARLAPLAAAVTTRYGIGGLKAALDLLGYAGGTAVRAPLRTPGEEARREIARLLEETVGDKERGTSDP